MRALELRLAEGIVNGSEGNIYVLSWWAGRIALVLQIFECGKQFLRASLRNLRAKKIGPAEKPAPTEFRT